MTDPTNALPKEPVSETEIETLDLTNTPIKMAEENATDALRMMRAQYEADVTNQETSLAELQKEMNLPRIPNRIECFDISTARVELSAGRVPGTGRRTTDAG